MGVYAHAFKPLRALFLALGLVSTPNAFFASVAAQPDTDSSVTLGVENIMHLPYYGLCDTGYCGYARDLFDAFSRDEAINIQYRPMPIPRLHRVLVAGEVDAKFPAHPDWANSFKEGADIHYSDPVITFTDGYLSLPGRTGTPTKVGTMRGFTLDFSPLPRKPMVIEANAESDLFRLLARGRVDAAYTNIGVLKAYMAREGIPESSIIFRRDLPYRKSQYFISSAKNPDLVKHFNGWLARSGDILAALQQKYGISPID
ncbi:MAG: transporter substrate-binding domain-containing protein [Alphaproteobacteria bacterium]|nr:transporter substrate-binding domain-containing protein [Alphaproteobacteria bacterium]